MSEYRVVVGDGYGGVGGFGLVLFSFRCFFSLGEVLVFILRIFLEFMEYGVVFWETFSIFFVRKVGRFF